MPYEFQFTWGWARWSDGGGVGTGTGDDGSTAVAKVSASAAADRQRLKRAIVRRRIGRCIQQFLSGCAMCLDHCLYRCSTAWLMRYMYVFCYL
jgi:hypothetical protein